MKTVRTLLATTVVTALAVSACGSTAKSEPTTQNGDGWQIYFPNKVTTSTQEANGLTITIHGDDGKKATSNGVIVNHSGNIVQATMLDVGTNNTDDSAAFLASLTFD
ncbi:MAG: hypothetical protein ABIR32_12065 [Ilumatobacteraceae bacterium]